MMRNYPFNPLSRALFTLVTLTSVLACGSGAGTFPQIADPPPFDYVDGAELRSGMHQLAFELQQLDLALLSEEGAGASNNRNMATSQRDVVNRLRNMERIGGNLREGDLSSTHDFLRSDMNVFLTTVGRARREAEANPPRYYAAGRVSGACVNCHRVNQ